MRAALAVAAIVAVLALVPARSLAQPAPAPAPGPAPGLAPVGAPAGDGGPSPSNLFTMAEVETHNMADDCWIVIDGSVYDITKWIPLHPGGEMPLLAQCGRDATNDFMMQHSGDYEPQETLPKYFRGTLVMP